MVEIGAGLGSLTVALADAGAEVLAVEFDRMLVPALAEVVGDRPNVRILHADAMKHDWEAELGAGPWLLVANLPYNLATPLVLDVLEGVPAIVRIVVMVQREVGERLVAPPGSTAYGAPSVRAAARARVALVRLVPPEVFWPRPSVESVVVRLDRIEPEVDVEDPRLWRVIEAGFAQRRKTMRNALRRLGLDAAEADRALRDAGLEPGVRAEELGIDRFAAIAAALPA